MTISINYIPTQDYLVGENYWTCEHPEEAIERETVLVTTGNYITGDADDAEAESVTCTACGEMLESDY